MLRSALIRDPATGGWTRFERPVENVCAWERAEVMGALRRIEEAVESGGLAAVGCIAYEAAPAFDPAFRTAAPADGLPLLCFGLFEGGSGGTPSFGAPAAGFSIGAWAPSQDRESYRQSIGRIRDCIAGAATYQVNHTFRMRATFTGDPASFFTDLVRAQPRCHAALLDMGERVVCSASPELMLQLDGERILSRPMKGTADRGRDLASDRAAVEALRRSEKNRAENAMIVDMVRNDLGRVADVGTVRVSARFDVERHPTVLQMTSTVEAETRADISEILGALFPFASVTGAPKVRTMELISELENEPRGVYTGAIGVIRPGRRARFSVAIRTAVVDLEAGEVEYGVGSGVVWDSGADAEYDECLAKARILTEHAQEFELLETLLWEPDAGFFLLDRHLDRLVEAAEYFGRPFDRKVMSERFRTVPGPQFRSCHSRPSTPLDIDDNSGTADLAPTILLRVRVLLAADGSLRVETDPIEL
ncbi:MAG: chorismate-binding protein, partial [Thermoanaerobaculales bacterium]|nr:chorismate-binding protein [Thermoanaerobaculales bacterium]